MAEEKTTVKAREHYGAHSLDLTIPSKIRRRYSLNPGDVFEVTVDSEGELVIKFRKVYSAGV